MTFPSDIDTDPKNVDVKVVLALFAMMFLFVFWFAMCLIFILGAKVVVAFHICCTSFKRKVTGSLGDLGDPSLYLFYYSMYVGGGCMG